MSVPITFILLGEPRDGLPLEMLEPTISPFSGRALSRYHVVVSVRYEWHQELTEELEAAHSGQTLIMDTSGGRWKVGHRRVSYEGNDPTATLHRHDVELEEDEASTLECIEFDGLSVRPERWRLDSQNGTCLSILVDLTPTQHEQFEHLLERRKYTAGESPYSEVMLVGVSEEATPMGFGLCLWEPVDGGKTRHAITLTKKNDDEKPVPWPLLLMGEPTRSRLIQHTVATRNMGGALIDELRRAGILDAAAVERIKAASGAAPSFADLREFDRAVNIENFHS